MPEFGDDVHAVVEAEEAALRLPGKVLGVVGVDTFQILFRQPVEHARDQAGAFRRDYAGTMKAVVKQLFHPTHPRRSWRTPSSACSTRRPKPGSAASGFVEGWSSSYLRPRTVSAFSPK